MDCIFVTSFVVALKKQHLLLDLFVFAKFLRTSEVDNNTHLQCSDLWLQTTKWNGLQQITGKNIHSHVSWESLKSG